MFQIETFNVENNNPVCKSLNWPFPSHPVTHPPTSSHPLTYKPTYRLFRPLPHFPGVPTLREYLLGASTSLPDGHPPPPLHSFTQSWWLFRGSLLSIHGVSNQRNQINSDITLYGWQTSKLSPTGHTIVSFTIHSVLLSRSTAPSHFCPIRIHYELEGRKSSSSMGTIPTIF